jgi:hypothetical protein
MPETLSADLLFVLVAALIAIAPAPPNAEVVNSVLSVRKPTRTL